MSHPGDIHIPKSAVRAGAEHDLEILPSECWEQQVGQILSDCQRGKESGVCSDKKGIVLKRND